MARVLRSVKIFFRVLAIIFHSIMDQVSSLPLTLFPFSYLEFYVNQDAREKFQITHHLENDNKKVFTVF